MGEKNAAKTAIDHSTVINIKKEMHHTKILWEKVVGSSGCGQKNPALVVSVCADEIQSFLFSNTNW